MSETLDEVRVLVARGEVQISLHGYEELAAGNILVRDVMDGLAAAVVVEDYPDYPKGPCVLILEQDQANQPIHVLWGIPAGQKTPAVMVAAYRPPPDEMGRDVAKEATVNIKPTKRWVREGEFAAEVEVTLVEAAGPGAPYLSLEDAYKLDDVREALRVGDVRRASRLANRVYRLTPVEA